MKYISIIILFTSIQANAILCDPEGEGNEYWVNPPNMSIDTSELFYGGDTCEIDIIALRPPRGGYAYQEFDEFSYIIPELTGDVLSTSMTIDFKTLFDGLQSGSEVDVFEFDVFGQPNQPTLNLRIRLIKTPLSDPNYFKWKVHVLWYDTTYKPNGQQIDYSDDYFWIDDGKVDSGWIKLNIHNFGSETHVQAISSLKDANGALVMFDTSADPNSSTATDLFEVINYSSPFTNMNGLPPAEQRMGIIHSSTLIPQGSGMAIYPY